MKIQCPVCKARIFHKRIDDGFESHYINPDGTIEYIDSVSEGGDEFACSHNASHKFPEKLVRRLLDIVHDDVLAT